MSNSSITLKHNKHRIHPCPNDKKLELLNLLITQNSKAKIFVMSTNSLELIKESIKNDRVCVIEDSDLIEYDDLMCDILISYDLPDNADTYISRLSRVREIALILLDSSEQKQLYPIETLLKRVIKQDVIDGFEYKEEQKLKVAQKPLQKPKREYEFKKEYEQKPKFDNSKKDSFKSDKKSFDKPKRDDKNSKWEKKDKKPNKFLGKDENGKALFSGKSGDRNHKYDGTPKDKYSTPKKVGRKISIKERKPKESEDSNS